MKPILFVDFHGTLSNDYFWRNLSAESTEKIENLLFKSDSRLVDEWMRGVHTSEEVNRRIADEFGLEYEYVWKVFVEDCKTLSIPIDSLAAIGELRNRYMTVLITNNMDSLNRFTVPSLGLNSYFDHIVNSYDEKILKNENEGELFIRVVDRLKSNINECVLIDDSKSVCDLFNNLGGTSLQVTKEQSLNECLRGVHASTFIMK